jgi:type VI secretion system protein ImpA
MLETKMKTDGELLNVLLSPIPGDEIAGEDIAFAPEVDEIREARREDDTSLTQGEWETALKTAQWPRVMELCEGVLRDKSKDLQIAAWYTEALTKVNGFAGLAFGVKVLDGLITDFWEFVHPAFDPADLEERIGKIEWLNNQLTLVVRNIPLTSKASGAYAWLKWEESRQVENLGLKDAEARQKAIDEGKLSGDAFAKAVAASGLSFYEALRSQIREATAVLAGFEMHVDEKFGRDAPSLKDLREALGGCGELTEKMIAKLGGAAPQAASGQDLLGEQQMESSTIEAQTNTQPVAVGSIRSRGDAINALRAVSRYFRANEPHSPVSLLAERAAKWAEMPIESWLSSVIKDESTLRELRELLDVHSVE